jgi:hypothetical protein
MMRSALAVVTVTSIVGVASPARAEEPEDNRISLAVAPVIVAGFDIQGSDGYGGRNVWFGAARIGYERRVASWCELGLGLEVAKSYASGPIIFAPHVLLRAFITPFPDGHLEVGGAFRAGLGLANQPSLTLHAPDVPFSGPEFSLEGGPRIWLSRHVAFDAVLNLSVLSAGEQSTQGESYYARSTMIMIGLGPRAGLTFGF